MEERVELYISGLPPGESIPVGIEPFTTYDYDSQGEDIEGGVQYLCSHSSGGLSRMQAEHIQGWFSASTWDQDPAPEHLSGLWNLSRPRSGTETYPSNAHDIQSFSWRRLTVSTEILYLPRFSENPCLGLFTSV